MDRKKYFSLGLLFCFSACTAFAAQVDTTTATTKKTTPVVSSPTQAIPEIADATTKTHRDPENLTPEKIPEQPAPVNANDPIGGVNRAIYQFNDFLDRAILKPTATLYNKLMPKPIHRGITNIFNNIDNVPTIVNDILQTNFYQATSDSWRLFVNTTVGILGFFDVASTIGLERNHEDFGLTLAYWGYKESTYLVVPFFGPGTIRDLIGWPIDYFFFSIYPHIPDATTRYVVYGVGVVDQRANLLQYQNVFEQAALDKYTFMRNAYLQHRKYQMERNKELGDPYLESLNTKK